VVVAFQQQRRAIAIKLGQREPSPDAKITLVKSQASEQRVISSAEHERPIGLAHIVHSTTGNRKTSAILDKHLFLLCHQRASQPRQQRDNDEKARAGQSNEAIRSPWRHDGSMFNS
jgi:hypothetical protein